MTFGSFIYFITHWTPLTIIIEFKSPRVTWKLAKMRDSIKRKQAEKNK